MTTTPLSVRRSNFRRSGFDEVVLKERLDGPDRLAGQQQASVTVGDGYGNLFRGLDECRYHRIGRCDQSVNTIDSPSIGRLKYVGVTIEIEEV